MIKKCDICKVDFETNRNSQKRCSKECSQKAQYKNNANNVRRRRKKALGLVRDFLGGRCVICGYDTSSWALEAHHINPETKEFPLGSCLTRSLDKLLEEAKKCILFCANSHREHHHGLITNVKLIDIHQKEQLGRILWLQELHEQEVKTPNTCINCGQDINYRAERCKHCYHKHQEKIIWPPTEELLAMVEETSFSAVGRELGISDNGIRKRIKNHPV